MSTINVFKTKNNTWILDDLNDNWTASTFEIDGELVVLKQGVKNLECQNKPIEAFKVTERTVVDYYKNSDESLKLTVEEYNNQVNELTKNQEYYDGSYEWDSLEKEFAYRKFLKEWSTVTKIESVKTKINLIYKELPISDYPFIVPLYSVGQISDPFCSYIPPLRALVKMAAEKYGFEDAGDNAKYEKTAGKKWSVDPNAKDLQYIKINGKYPFSKDEFRRFHCLNAPYEECVQKYKKDLKYLEDFFAAEARVLDCVKLDENERLVLVKKINELIVCLNNVDPKSVSRVSYNSAVKISREIKESL